MTSREYHIAYGLHSGIPHCCVMFFVNEWDAQGMYKARSPYVRALSASEYDYVPCPECFGTKTMVRIKDCIVDCGRECREDFK